MRLKRFTPAKQGNVAEEKDSILHNAECDNLSKSIKFTRYTKTTSIYTNQKFIKYYLHYKEKC